MQHEFGKYIKELLYKHQRLSIPGFGSFELKQAPAFLDQVQTQLIAPSMDISFNEHLVMDDGILAGYVGEQKKWKLEQSQQWLNTQVEKINSALEKREIVELKGIGRFFKNFEQQLKFVAENNNFNTNSYGLKKINAQAVNYSLAERKAVHSAPLAAENKIAAVAENKEISWLRENLWWLALLVLLSSVLATYFFLPDSNKPLDPIVDVPEERLNASPSKEIDDQAVDITTEETQEEEIINLSENQDTRNPETILVPDEHTAIIAVGLFGDKKNVQKLLEKLSKWGFSPVSQDENGKIRVGVSIRFEEEKELQAILKEIQKKQEPSAFVMYRDGLRVE